MAKKWMALVTAAGLLTGFTGVARVGAEEAPAVSRYGGEGLLLG